MDVNEIAAWIVDRYGQFHYRHTAKLGVYTAAVKVYGSIAFGFGSSYDNALYDLYCDLCLPSARQPVEGLTLLPWEIEHRQQQDAETVVKLKKK